MKRYFYAHIFIELLLLLLGVLLVGYNIEGYPAFTALDEGLRLYFAKQVAEHGTWALATQDGYRAYWRDSTRLLILGPIILAFKLFGPSLGLARWVIGIFLVLGIFIVYRAINEWYGTLAAILAVALFLFFGPPWLNSVTMGRWVYGELPALVLFIAGCWQWGHAVEQRSQRLLGASLIFALAVLAKDLFAPLIMTTMLAVYRYARWSGDVIRMRHIGLPIVSCFIALGGWSLWQYAVSLPYESAHQHDVLYLSLSRIIVLTPQVSLANIKFLYDGGVLIVIPAALYVAFLRQYKPKPTFLILPFSLFIWSVWYAIFSIGWPRYAYPIWAIGGVLLSVVMSDIAKQWYTMINEQSVLQRVLYLICVAMGLSIVVLWPAQNTIRRLTEQLNNDAPNMAAYIDANIPHHTRIVSGQWEVSFYSSRTYIPIPDEYYEAKIAEQSRRSFTITHFTSMNDLNAEYILDGSENRIVEMVPVHVLQRDYKPVFQNDSYCLYRLRNVK